MTKEELREYRWLVKNISNLEDRLLELESVATKVTTTLQQDVVDCSSNQSKMADQVASIIELQDTINEQLTKMYALQNKLQDKICDMPEREKCLLTLKYIEGLTWEEVAVEMGYSWQHIHRLHSIALRMLNKKRR